MTAQPLRHSPSDHGLALRIAQEAAAGDLVRLHGAIALALKRHGVSLAFVAVFRPALRNARIAHGEECQVTVAQAVQAHIDQGAATPT
jgi:hypothetical protein